MEHQKLHIYQKHWAAYFYKKHPAHIRGYVKAFITRAHEIHAYYRIMHATISRLFITPRDHEELTCELEDVRNEVSDVVCILYLLYDEQELGIETRNKKQLLRIITKLEEAVRTCNELIHAIKNDYMYVSLGERQSCALDYVPHTVDLSVIQQEFKVSYREN